MLIATATAPSYEQLRPRTEKIISNTFPVYHNLTDLLVKIKQPPSRDIPNPEDLIVAHVLATCAGYAYSDAQTVSMIMARMGLEDNRCLQISETVDAMSIVSTAFLLQSKDGRVVILCYRGTRPTDTINWLTDIEVSPEKIRFRLGPGEYDVHGGFYRNVRSTRYQVITALARALNGQSIHPDGEARLDKGPDHRLEALYVTGHSLGGAMAALLAAMLKAEDNPKRKDIADKLYPVHTFGQPMVGTEGYAAACQAWPWDEHTTLSDNLVRWIYRHDVVPQLPPQACGPFAHYGREYQYSDGQSWHRNLRPVQQLNNLFAFLEAPLTILTRQLRLTRNLPFASSFDDHLPQHYVTKLAPDWVTSEYGD